MESILYSSLGILIDITKVLNINWQKIFLIRRKINS